MACQKTAVVFIVLALVLSLYRASMVDGRAVGRAGHCSKRWLTKAWHNLLKLGLENCVESYELRLFRDEHQKHRLTVNATCGPECVLRAHSKYTDILFCQPRRRMNPGAILDCD